MTNQQRATLYYEFAKLLKAGLHIDRSTELLLEQRPVPPIRRYLLGLQRGLQERLGFAGAVATHNAAITSSLEITLLTAGEQGGRLESSCQHLAEYFELKHKSRAKAVGAMIYPLILLHLGLILPDIPALVTGASLESMIPQILTRLMIVWALLVGLGLVWSFLGRESRYSPWLDRMVNAIPLVGSVRRHWALARFSQVFETSLLSGMSITEAVVLSGQASQRACLEEASRKIAQAIEGGDSLGNAFAAQSVFPRSFQQAVATAEQTGTLDVEMGRWAQAESGLAASAQDRLAEWLPRLFYFAVVLYVASRIIGSVQGLYGPGGFYEKLLNGLE